MVKTATKKEKVALRCAHCLEAPETIAISGQTATGKNDAMIPFQVCQLCYTEMDNKYGNATTKLNLRKTFWEKVNMNVLKLTQK